MLRISVSLPWYFLFSDYPISIKSLCSFFFSDSFPALFTFTFSYFFSLAGRRDLWLSKIWRNNDQQSSSERSICNQTNSDGHAAIQHHGLGQGNEYEQSALGWIPWSLSMPEQVVE